MRPHRFIQKVMADALRANETLRASGVTVIEQDSPDLAFLLKKPLGGRIRADEIGLRASESGMVLPCGSTAIWER